MDLVVWDLHGVMEKGNEVSVMEISNEVLSEFSDVRFTLDMIHALYGLPWRDYFKELLPSLGEARYLELEAQCVALGHASFDRVKANMGPTQGLHSVLKAIEAAGHEQIVLSNTDKKGLPKFMDILGIHPFFPPKRAIASEGSSKPELLQSYIDGRDFDNIVIIDDSQAGVDLARLVEGVSIAFVHPEFRVRVQGEDYFAQTMAALENIIVNGERMRTIPKRERFYTEKDFTIGKRVRLFLDYGYREGRVIEGAVKGFGKSRGGWFPGVQLSVEKKHSICPSGSPIVRAAGIWGEFAEPRHPPSKYPYTATYQFCSIVKAAQLPS